MARAAKKKTTRKTRKRKSAKPKQRFALRLWFWRWVGRGVLAAVALFGIAVLGFAVFDPPTTPYMMSEARRLGSLEHQWVDLNDISPVLARAVVAAEDANYCQHWGFDIGAIRIALEDGAGRGASTISQQVVKNVFLWQGRSWARKALESVMTPVVEAVWTKRRILEVYLNVVEFGDGVFGIDAAAWTNFRVGPGALSATQAGRLAAVLPDPKDRSARNPSEFVRARGRAAVSGAATILADGRARCFES